MLQCWSHNPLPKHSQEKLELFTRCHHRNLHQMLPYLPAQRLISWNNLLIKTKEILPILRECENRRPASLFSYLHLNILEIQAACFLVSAPSGIGSQSSTSISGSIWRLTLTALPPPLPASAIWAEISSSLTTEPALPLAGEAADPCLFHHQPSRKQQ